MMLHRSLRFVPSAVGLESRALLNGDPGIYAPALDSSPSLSAIIYPPSTGGSGAAAPSSISPVGDSMPGSGAEPSLDWYVADPPPGSDPSVEWGLGGAGDSWGPEEPEWGLGGAGTSWGAAAGSDTQSPSTPGDPLPPTPTGFPGGTEPAPPEGDGTPPDDEPSTPGGPPVPAAINSSPPQAPLPGASLPGASLPNSSPPQDQGLVQANPPNDSTSYPLGA